MSGRPRPVTATVTKPRWMQIPNPDAIRKIRHRPLDSNGSTASLTSLLDHDSCLSASEADDLSSNQNSESKPANKINNRTRSLERKPARPDRGRSAGSKSDTNRSAWEQWVVEKAKADRLKKQAEIRRKKEEKEAKEKAEEEKRNKLLKADAVRQAWLEQKNQEMKQQKKAEREKKRNEKREKDEAERKIQQNATVKYSEWLTTKNKEDEERRRQMKEANKRIQEHKEKKKQIEEQNFKEWLKKAKNRPKSAPNSFGYLSGKVTGYHDRSAYPQPSFYNPLPWQPVAIPPSHTQEKKSKKPKVKPYRWNPDKYF